MKHLNQKIWLLTIILGSTVWPALPAGAQVTCAVDNTGDTDATLPPAAGSLRFCMANARSGDSIVFDAGVFDVAKPDADTTINALSELPALDDGNVTIDASNRRVTVNGSGAGSASGLRVTSGGNQIMGLSIIGFSQSGIQIDSGAANKVGGNRALPAPGTGPNGQGLRLAGNGAFGIEISGAGTSGNTVKGCWIGLDASGQNSQSNLVGIVIQGGAASNTIGSVIADEGNVISGNTQEGVTVADAGSDDNVIIGNVIGESATVDSAGARSAVSNGNAGMFMSRGTQNTKVGGETSGEANSIGFNGGNGVEVRATSSKQNSIRSNRIGRNTRGGIALFDGSNGGIAPPRIDSVQDLGDSGSGTGLTLRLTGVTPQDGNMEVFSDSGNQGETFLARKDVLSGTWTADADVSDVLNLSATLTDALGNTSQFSVFGLTSVDTDGDGFSDVLEGLAGTDPGDRLAQPLLAGVLSPSKLQIKLNFASAGKDSIKMTSGVTLPPGFTADGATVGVYVAGHSEQFTLDADGKASSSNSSVALKTSAKMGPYMKYGIKLASLQAALASSGLSEKTTTDDETWVIPVAITMGSSVSFASIPVTYKATQGKTGKAKL